MTTTKPKRSVKPRKPRSTWIKYRSDWRGGSFRVEVDRFIYLAGRLLSPKEARKLAAWLLKAADYLEGKVK